MRTSCHVATVSNKGSNTSIIGTKGIYTNAMYVFCLIPKYISTLSYREKILSLIWFLPNLLSSFSSLSIIKLLHTKQLSIRALGHHEGVHVQGLTTSCLYGCWPQLCQHPYGCVRGRNSPNLVCGDLWSFLWIFLIIGRVFFERFFVGKQKPKFHVDLSIPTRWGVFSSIDLTWMGCFFCYEAIGSVPLCIGWDLRSWRTFFLFKVVANLGFCVLGLRFLNENGSICIWELGFMEIKGWMVMWCWLEPIRPNMRLKGVSGSVGSRSEPIQACGSCDSIRLDVVEGCRRQCSAVRVWKAVLPWVV